MMKALRRIFDHKGLLLDDPNPLWSEDKVRSHYANLYPELLNSNVQFDKTQDDKAVFKFNTNVGSKG